MKLSSITILTAAALSLTACNSLDNPVANLFHSAGHDERVYNPQTGQWEWPAEKRAKQEKKSAAVASTLASTPVPHGFNDTRYWDPQRNEWVSQQAPHVSTPAKPKPTPAPSEPAAAAGSQFALAPTPRPSRATGVYNSATGKIEWQNSGESVPPEATPAPKKHWYWPF
jgi:hypothetical protein